MRRRTRLFAVFPATLVVAALALTFIGSDPPPHHVILIGVDGFRWDYLDRYGEQAPNLRRLAEAGVRARRLIPAFPTRTFPNFYSMATGLRPERHGIVNNSMYDPVFDATFTIGDASAVTDGRWWGGEPIWVTAERQGVVAGTMFWVGSEAEIRGRRPSFWMRYDVRMPNEDRVDTVLAWLRRPRPPTLVLLYFSDLDRAGHDHGPDSPQVARALNAVDASVGRLLGGIEAMGLAERVDLVVAADHGMAAASRSAEWSIFLGDYTDLTQVRSGFGPSVGISPASNDPDTAAAQLARFEHDLLGAHPALHVLRRETLAPGAAGEAERRWPPVTVVADEGWTIRSGRRADYRPRDPMQVGGAHGYLPEAETMHGIFLAYGPSFRKGVVLDRLHVVDIYGIIAHVLTLEPAENEGATEVIGEVVGPKG